jgi:hypothetical protein
MANKHRGEVSIKLDKMRKIRFNTHALAELEDALGYPLSKLDTEDVGIKTIVKMFWAGMLHELPDLTLREAADLMDYSTFAEVSEKIKEALELAFGNHEDTVKKTKSGLNGVGKN